MLLAVVGVALSLTQVLGLSALAATERGFKPAKFNPKVLVGNYVATDCVDTIHQPEIQESAAYVNTRLTVAVKNGKLSLAYPGVSDHDYLRAVSDSLEFDESELPAADISEKNYSAYGVYKVSRAAELPGFRAEWEIESEGYGVSGLHLTAKHIEQTSNGKVEKTLSCHYAKL